MEIIEALSRFSTAMSFRAKGLPSIGSPSASTCITACSSMAMSPLYISSRASLASPGSMLARKPSLPMLMPMMGVPLGPTLLAAFRNVPSPPSEMT